MSAFTTMAFAQYSPPKFEVFGEYSYLRFNPSLSGLNTRSFNGGGGGVQYNFNRFFGAKAEFFGYGSTRWTVTNTAPIVTNQGTIPIGVFTSHANMFTYLFGPVVGIHARRFNVFGEVLFGGSNSNGFGKLTSAVVANGGTISVNGTQHPFTMAVGGGVDFNLGKLIAIRLGEVDYFLTRYTNPFTNTNNQNSFRYAGGVVFKFGGSQ
jgi:hypothetical protein